MNCKPIQGRLPRFSAPCPVPKEAPPGYQGVREPQSRHHHYCFKLELAVLCCLCVKGGQWHCQSSAPRGPSGKWLISGDLGVLHSQRRCGLHLTKQAPHQCLTVSLLGEAAWGVAFSPGKASFSVPGTCRNIPGGQRHDILLKWCLWTEMSGVCGHTGVFRAPRTRTWLTSASWLDASVHASVPKE